MFGLMFKSTHEAAMAEMQETMSEALDTARCNERTRYQQVMTAMQERDGARLALKAVERQLGQANAKLAMLTTRGPGGRFVRPGDGGSAGIAANGSGARV